MESLILEAMAKAFFASAYADAYDSAVSEGIDPGFNPSGCEWMDLLPEEMDPAAEHAARTLAMDLQRVNGGMSLDELFMLTESVIAEHGGGDRDLSSEMFGNYLAMQAMGHGVGLSDAFGQAVDDAITVPYVEFTDLSLERDYFTAAEGES